MPTVAEIMSSDVESIEPQQSLREAAQRMQQRDVGSLPVCNGRDLLGMVTDRDITVRGVAAGLDPQTTCVSDVMSEGIVFCTADQDAREVMDMMGESQLRRLPVLDASRQLIGIVALADLALRQSAHIDATVRSISQPD